LPDGDGLMLLQALKTNPATQSIPVILLTAKEIDENSLEFNSCKVAGVILKPFNVLELSDRIAVLLGW
jgi:DNA-binding response OmpR family regulator